MKPLFADTSYFIALLSEADQKHEAAVHWSENWLGRTVVTEYVFIELGNALSRGRERRLVPPYIAHTLALPETVYLPAAQRLFQLGLDLHARRPDKTWSLVDCISFVVMKQQRITQALTTDHHFEQAGFKALLR